MLMLASGRNAIYPFTLSGDEWLNSKFSIPTSLISTFGSRQFKSLRNLPRVYPEFVPSVCLLAFLPGILAHLPWSLPSVLAYLLFCRGSGTPCLRDGMMLMLASGRNTFCLVIPVKTGIQKVINLSQRVPPPMDNKSKSPRRILFSLPPMLVLGMCFLAFQP